MKKQMFGAMLLIAALIVTCCGNKKQKDQTSRKEERKTIEMEPNQLLIVVDPQVDFTTGSLATAKGPEAMDRLANAINNGILEKYSWVAVTQDAHPANHCSFVENGGVFPPHCVQGTEGMNVYPNLQNAFDTHKEGVNFVYLQKGNLPEREEFSIFQNEMCGTKLRETILDKNYDIIDVCGIATDYCVYETVKDLMEFYPATQIRIVTNCIAAVDDNDTKLADLMKEKGIEGITF